MATLTAVLATALAAPSAVALAAGPGALLISDNGLANYARKPKWHNQRFSSPDDF